MSSSDNIHPALRKIFNVVTSLLSGMIMSGILQSYIDARHNTSLVMLVQVLLPLILTHSISILTTIFPKPVSYLISRFTRDAHSQNHAFLALQDYMERNSTKLEITGGTLEASVADFKGAVAPAETMVFKYRMTSGEVCVSQDLDQRERTYGNHHSQIVDRYRCSGPPKALDEFRHTIMSEYKKNRRFGINVRTEKGWIYIPAAEPRHTVPNNTACQRGLFDDYARAVEDNDGAQFRRGYMLHGPPGTGKTNAALLFAAQFKLEIYIITREDLQTKPITILQGILNRNKHNNFIVLLEDIDVAPPPPANAADRSSRTSTAEKTTQVNISALLAVLGGAVAIQGMITIFNTNNIEFYRQFPALMRPGRIDSFIEVGYAEDVQIRSIASRSGMSDKDVATLLDMKRPDATVAEYISAVEQQQQGDATCSSTAIVLYLQQEQEKRREQKQPCERQGEDSASDTASISSESG